jgi:hypothetical protein
MYAEAMENYFAILKEFGEADKKEL